MLAPSIGSSSGNLFFDDETTSLATASSVMPPPDAAVAVVVEQVLASVVHKTVQETVFATVLAVAAASRPSPVSVLEVLQQYRVPMYENDLQTTLTHLEQLRHALRQLPRQQEGGAPGFVSATTATFDQAVGRRWFRAPDTPYEVLEGMTNTVSVPLPTPDFILRCCEYIQKVLTLRLEYQTLGKMACREAQSAGIADWDCYKGSVAESLMNNALETYMFEEASDILNRTVDPETWKAAYAKELCPIPLVDANDAQLSYIAHTPVRLLKQRDEYLQCAMKLIMSAEKTIQINTCYFFAHDPATRYIMLDLLPYCIRHHNVTVHMLVDLMTMESAMVKSGFENKDTHKTTNVAEDRTGTVTSTSFLKFLPPSAPDYAATERITPLVFLQTLLDTAALYGEQYQVRWWCARDATHGYRVKNHSKSIVVDGQVAIMGGSNLAPQLNAATTEVDLILTGPVARDVSASTAALWKAASAAPPANTVSLSAKESWVPLPKNGDDKAVETPLASRLQRFVEEEAWADDNCHVAIVRSQPSQTGEDDIFRVILGAMHTATKSITMCFGHSGYPRVVAEALALASARNVRCQIIVNSYYSNDLRGGQRDLFISLRDILEIAPKTEIYVTAPKNGAGPPFLHSKYIVIDSKWSACGSFNLWTRSSFFEIEHEAMIESEIIAKQLEEKFECEKETFTIPLATPEDALRFMPDECCICPGFGPFFKE